MFDQGNVILHKLIYQNMCLCMYDKITEEITSATMFATANVVKFNSKGRLNGISGIIRGCLSVCVAASTLPPKKKVQNKYKNNNNKRKQ